MDYELEMNLPEILNGEDKSSAFVNCIRKNYKHVRKFAKRTRTNCFRIYDREVKGFPLAIDFYAGRYCVHYFSPYDDSEEKKEAFMQETESALKLLFGAKKEMIFWRTRQKAKLTRQYEKNAETRHFFTVMEYGVKFQVNLEDYLDTGLFLDHREARRYVSLEAKGKKLLNLFAYTSSFSVHAACMGAIFTKSVDMSNTYTDWSFDNFILNEIDLKNHEIVRADCLKFLNEEVKTKNSYDIIVIDPPTISRSKKMDQLFDVQIDYLSLIHQSLKMLNPGGFIFFSTNSRKFQFDETAFKGCQILEISEKTLPVDFHDQKIRRAWKITKPC